MTTVQQMLDSYPADLGRIDMQALARRVEACGECTQACTAYADACLSEEMVDQLTKCIRTDLDCADVCATTAKTLSCRTGYDANVTRAVLQACVAACKACGDECASHANMHDHCRICADACRACQQACEALLATLG